MKVYVGLGSNLKNRMFYLRSAVRELKKKYLVTRTSLVYETPPLSYSLRHPMGKTFLNAVVEIELPDKNQSLCGARSVKKHKRSPCSPLCGSQFFKSLKEIERLLGRTDFVSGSNFFSPREIDCDLLLFGDYTFQVEPSQELPGGLIVPHKELLKRNFVLSPLKELCPHLKIPGQKKNVLQLYRELKNPLPTWMNIINITPDSFSEKTPLTLSQFQNLLKTTNLAEAHIWDLGAESSRPGATSLTVDREWGRLESFLTCFQEYYKEEDFKPLLSVDTRNLKTAQLSIQRGANIINDVSGLKDLRFLDLLKDSSVQYVLMHSLSVPADLKKTLSNDKDPVEEIKKWLNFKCEILEKHSINLERVIFDPGIGFGKTPEQCLEILKRIRDFLPSSLRIMLGHSKKSFMNLFSKNQAFERTSQSIGISLALAKSGVDILRVHHALKHEQAWLAQQWVKTVIPREKLSFQ